MYWCDSRPCSKVIWPHFDRVVPLAGVGGVDGSFEASVDLHQRAPDRCVEAADPTRLRSRTAQCPWRLDENGRWSGRHWDLAAGPNAAAAGIP